MADSLRIIFYHARLFLPFHSSMKNTIVPTRSNNDIARKLISHIHIKNLIGGSHRHV